MNTPIPPARPLVLSPLPVVFSQPRPVTLGVGHCEERARQLRLDAEEAEACARTWERLADLRESDEPIWKHAREAIEARLDARSRNGEAWDVWKEHAALLNAIADAVKACAKPVAARPPKPRDPYACPECGKPHCCSSAHRSGSGD